LITFGPLSIALLDTLDAVVGAPIVEEIIFRGLLFGALVRSMGFVAAAIVSSLVFAAVHGYGLEGTLAVTLTGSLLCWIYWRTGRLWTAILAHGVHNAIVVLPMWAARAMSVGAN
jgi:membrane protease YdiL (CAAX protease family)